MQMDKRELHKRILVNLGVTLLWILLIIICGPWLLRFFRPVIIAWIIAMVTNPLVSFLEKRIKLMRKHGSAIVILLALILVAAILTLLVWWIYSEVSGWVVGLPDLYQTIMNNLQEVLTPLHERFSFLPDRLEAFLSGEKINEYIVSALDSLKTSPIQMAGGVAGSIIDGLVMSILTLLLAYYFVVDKDKLSQWIHGHTSKRMEEVWEMMKRIFINAVGGYLKACFKIMFIMFFILLVFFLALGVDYAVVIALIVAVLDFLPFIGTGTILWPWAVYSVLMGRYVQGMVLVIAYFVTLIIRRLIEPKLVGDSIGISPFLTLISMFIGYRFIGMLGLIVGIPIGMLLKGLIDAGVFESQIRGIKILAEDIREYRKY